MPEQMTTAAAPDYRRAEKHSVTIAGHETSILIEPAFWALLLSVAADQAIPVNALIARIDADRLDSARFANRPPPNLASAIRLWALATARAPSGSSAQ